jgi:hypothetical protein
LTEAGVHPDRFVLEWASAAEAPLYVELITKFTNRVRDLGPLGEAEGISMEDLLPKLEAAKSVAGNVKLRTRFARLTQDMRQINDYTAPVIEGRMADKINEAIRSEMEKQIRA